MGSLRHHRILHKLWRSLRKHGPVRTAKTAWMKLRYERRFRVDTDFYVAPAELDVADPIWQHAVAYTPSSYLALHEAFASGRIDCRGRVLVDYGCGMGRALLVAATLPFKKIIGVEVSPRLADQARTNLTSYAATGPMPEWEVVTSDARDFEPPPDATVFYFYDPFDAAVFREVVARIGASRQAHPRVCTLFYLDPHHRQVLLEAGWRCLHLPKQGPAIFVISE
jgi:SAM-dependent methyltransferase